MSAFIYTGSLHILIHFEGWNRDEDLVYQIELWSKDLCRLCVQWSTEVQHVLPGWEVPDSWGPSSAELQGVSVENMMGSWAEGLNEGEIDVVLRGMENAELDGDFNDYDDIEVDEALLQEGQDEDDAAAMDEMEDMWLDQWEATDEVDEEHREEWRESSRGTTEGIKQHSLLTLPKKRGCTSIGVSGSPTKHQGVSVSASPSPVKRNAMQQ